MGCRARLPPTCPPALPPPPPQAAGTISLKHLYEIAQVKQRDTPHVPVESVVKSLMGSCRAMGVRVVPRPEDA